MKMNLFSIFTCVLLGCALALDYDAESHIDRMPHWWQEIDHGFLIPLGYTSEKFWFLSLRVMTTSEMCELSAGYGFSILKCTIPDKNRILIFKFHLNSGTKLFKLDLTHSNLPSCNKVDGGIYRVGYKLRYPNHLHEQDGDFHRLVCYGPKDKMPSIKDAWKPDDENSTDCIVVALSLKLHHCSRYLSSDQKATCNLHIDDKGYSAFVVVTTDGTSTIQIKTASMVATHECSDVCEFSIGQAREATVTCSDGEQHHLRAEGKVTCQCPLSQVAYIGTFAGIICRTTTTPISFWLLIIWVILGRFFLLFVALIINFILFNIRRMYRRTYIQRDLEQGTCQFCQDEISSGSLIQCHLKCSTGICPYCKFYPGLSGLPTHVKDCKKRDQEVESKIEYEVQRYTSLRKLVKMETAVLSTSLNKSVYFVVILVLIMIIISPTSAQPPLMPVGYPTYTGYRGSNQYSYENLRNSFFPQAVPYHTTMSSESILMLLARNRKQNSARVETTTKSIQPTNLTSEPPHQTLVPQLSKNSGKRVSVRRKPSRPMLRSRLSSAQDTKRSTPRMTIKNQVTRQSTSPTIPMTVQPLTTPQLSLNNPSTTLTVKMIPSSRSYVSRLLPRSTASLLTSTGSTHVLLNQTSKSSTPSARRVLFRKLTTKSRPTRNTRGFYVQHPHTTQDLKLRATTQSHKPEKMLASTLSTLASTSTTRTTYTPMLQTTTQQHTKTPSTTSPTPPIGPVDLRSKQPYFNNDYTDALKQTQTMLMSINKETTTIEGTDYNYFIEKDDMEFYDPINQEWLADDYYEEEPTETLLIKGLTTVATLNPSLAPTSFDSNLPPTDTNVVLSRRLKDFPTTSQAPMVATTSPEVLTQEKLKEMNYQMAIDCFKGLRTEGCEPLEATEQPFRPPSNMKRSLQSQLAMELKMCGTDCFHKDNECKCPDSDAEEFFSSGGYRNKSSNLGRRYKREASGDPWLSQSELSDLHSSHISKSHLFKYKKRPIKIREMKVINNEMNNVFGHHGFTSVEETYKPIISQRNIEVSWNMVQKIKGLVKVKGDSVGTLSIREHEGLSWTISSPDASNSRVVSVSILMAKQIYKTEFVYRTGSRKITTWMKATCSGDCPNNCACPPNSPCHYKLFENDRSWICNPTWCWRINSGCTCCAINVANSSMDWEVELYRVKFDRTKLIVCLEVSDDEKTCKEMDDADKIETPLLSLKLSKVFGVTNKLPDEIATYKYNQGRNHVNNQLPDGVWLSPDLCKDNCVHGVVGDYQEDQSRQERKMSWNGIDLTHTCTSGDWPTCNYYDLKKDINNEFEFKNKTVEHITSNFIVKTLKKPGNELILEVLPKGDIGMAEFLLDVKGMSLQGKEIELEVSSIKILSCEGCYGCESGFECLFVLENKPSETAIHLISKTSYLYLSKQSYSLQESKSENRFNGYTLTNVSEIEVCVKEKPEVCSVKQVLLKEIGHILSEKESIEATTYKDPNNHCTGFKWFSCLVNHMPNIFNGLWNIIKSLFSNWKYILMFVLFLLILIALYFLIRFIKVLFKKKRNLIVDPSQLQKLQ